MKGWNRQYFVHAGKAWHAQGAEQRSVKKEHTGWKEMIRFGNRKTGSNQVLQNAVGQAKENGSYSKGQKNPFTTCKQESHQLQWKPLCNEKYKYV